MTKTVKLTQNYIDNVLYLTEQKARTVPDCKKKYPTLTGDDIFCEFDITPLLVPGTGYRNKDVKADPKNVPLYYRNVDSLGRILPGVDLDNIHSTVSVELYILRDGKSTIEIPNDIADRLVGTVEEVT